MRTFSPWFHIFSPTKLRKIPTNVFYWNCLILEVWPMNKYSISPRVGKERVALRKLKANSDIILLVDKKNYIVVLDFLDFLNYKQKINIFFKMAFLWDPTSKIEKKLSSIIKKNWFPKSYLETFNSQILIYCTYVLIPIPIRLRHHSTKNKPVLHSLFPKVVRISQQNSLQKELDQICNNLLYNSYGT